MSHFLFEIQTFILQIKIWRRRPQSDVHAFDQD